MTNNFQACDNLFSLRQCVVFLRSFCNFAEEIIKYDYYEGLHYGIGEGNSISLCEG